MTPENEVSMPPTAERVGRELSRWFDHSELATRPQQTMLAPEGAQRVDWVRVAPFLAHACRLSCGDLGGIQLGRPRGDRRACT